MAKDDKEKTGNVTYREVSKPYGAYERSFLPALAVGLGTTIRHFFANVGGRRKYVSTVEYPDQKVTYPARFRGLHRLVPREDGKPRCVACFMCQTACPAHCIHIEAAETEDDSIEKYPDVFEIDELRCVVCGLCVEACPCDAIRMDSGVHPEPVRARDDAKLVKTDLLKVLGRLEDPKGQRDRTKPPATAGGTGRVDRTKGDGGAGGSTGGY